MNGGAARLWWLLRHFGHDDVAVLDGGMGAWLGPLRGGEEEIEAADVHARGRARATRSRPRSSRARLGEPGLTVVDARLPERYRGEVEPIDPVAGRIPGARQRARTRSELPPDLVDAEELVAYCGSGITAAVVLLRLAQAGRDDAKLYPGSWSDWCGRGLPAETG